MSQSGRPPLPAVFIDKVFAGEGRANPLSGVTTALKFSGYRYLAGSILSKMEITTVPAHYVNAVFIALEQRGWDRKALLRKFDFPEELLKEEKARIPRADYLRVTGYLALKFQDESFGLLKAPLKPGTFAMLCHSCITCDTLEHFLRRMAKYAIIANPSVLFELERNNEYATLTIIPPVGEVYGEDLYIMLALAVAHRLISWVTDHNVPLDEVSLSRKRPFYASDYNLLFNTNINFDQQGNHIRFSSEFLDKKIVQDEYSLRSFLQGSAINLMSKLESDNSLTSQIRNILKGEIADHFPDFKQISSSLNYSPTTLKRKLLMEGSTYQNIKDAVRRDKAIYYLAQGSMSVDEVAARAGFSDPPSFFRAFRRWTGTSPRAYIRRGDS